MAPGAKETLYTRQFYWDELRRRYRSVLGAEVVEAPVALKDLDPSLLMCGKYENILEIAAKWAGLTRSIFSVRGQFQ